MKIAEVQIWCFMTLQNLQTAAYIKYTDVDTAVMKCMFLTNIKEHTNPAVSMFRKIFSLPYIGRESFFAIIFS